MSAQFSKSENADLHRNFSHFLLLPGKSDFISYRAKVGSKGQLDTAIRTKLGSSTCEFLFLGPAERFTVSDHYLLTCAPLTSCLIDLCVHLFCLLQLHLISDAEAAAVRAFIAAVLAWTIPCDSIFAVSVSERS